MDLHLSIKAFGKLSLVGAGTKMWTQYLPAH